MNDVATALGGDLSGGFRRRGDTARPVRAERDPCANVVDAASLIVSEALKAWFYRGADHVYVAHNGAVPAVRTADKHVMQRRLGVEQLR